MENEEDIKTLGDYLEILQRRKGYLLIPFSVISLVALILALKLPPVYRSTATILIEAQQIPRNMVQTTITDFADERIQIIKQRVMTRPRVLTIIDKYRLYPEDQGQLTLTELVKQFQDDTEVNIIAADVIDPQQGRGTKASIAFSISFNNKQPATAQMVANELVSLFLEENTRVRTQRAIKTTQFLSEEAEKLRHQIQSNENQIADYKQKFGQSLPDLLESNLSTINRTADALGQTESQINLARNRIEYLTAGLARLKYEVPEPGNEKAALSKEDQIKVLKAEYLRLTSRYRSTHPDVLRVKRQIQELDPSFEGEPSAQDARLELARSKRELVALKQKYADSHPDVTKLQQKIKALEHEADEKAADADGVSDIGRVRSDPAYVSLTVQLKSSQMELESLVKRRAELQSTLEKVQKYVSQTPQVEREYLDLVRERENNLKKYAELRNKTVEAQLAQTLEEEQKGETFTLIDPPIVPEKPEKPNRKKIVFLGLIFGVFSGVGTTFVAESLNKRVHGHKALQQITGMVPLVVIPYIATQMEMELRQRQIKYTWIGFCVALVLSILAIHFFLLPLDQIWLKAMWRLEHL